jgi:hypothetical protein
VHQDNFIKWKAYRKPHTGKYLTMNMPSECENNIYTCKFLRISGFLCIRRIKIQNSQHVINCVRFSQWWLKITVFLDVMPYSLVDRSKFQRNLLLPVSVNESNLILTDTADPSKTLINTLKSRFQWICMPWVGNVLQDSYVYAKIIWWGYAVA